jgi:hypothetical protein
MGGTSGAELVRDARLGRARGVELDDVGEVLFVRSRSPRFWVSLDGFDDLARLEVVRAGRRPTSSIISVSEDSLVRTLVGVPPESCTLSSLRQLAVTVVIL